MLNSLLALLLHLPPYPLDHQRFHANRTLRQLRPQSVISLHLSLHLVSSSTFLPAYNATSPGYFIILGRLSGRNGCQSGFFRHFRFINNVEATTPLLIQNSGRVSPNHLVAPASRIDLMPVLISIAWP